MSLIVSTQSYSRGRPTEYGLLLEIDELDGGILRSCRIETPVDLPDGVGRIKPGLRGVGHFKNHLYVATWNAIKIVDLKSFECVGEISHKWMSDLHGVYVNTDGVWVTSTLPDAVILYDFNGRPIRSVWFSETNAYPEFKKIDKTIDWRSCGKGFRHFHFFHCNHVEVGNGKVFVTGRGGTTKNGRIYQFDQSLFRSPESDEECLPELVTDGLFGPHDGVVRDEGIWVTETSNSSVAMISYDGIVKHRFRLLSGEEDSVAEILVKNAVANVKNKLGKPGPKLSHWTRGLAVGKQSLYVGQSTWADSGESNARVLVVDIKSGLTKRVLSLDIANYPEARIFQVFQLRNQPAE